MHRRQWQYIKTLLLIADVIVTVVSFFLAYMARDYLFKENYGTLQGVNIYVWMLSIIIPLWPTMLSLFNVYDMKTNRNFQSIARIIFRIVPAVIIADLFLTSIFYFTGRQEISRLFFVIFAAINIALLWVEKISVHFFWRQMAKDKSNCKKIIVVTCVDRNYFTEYVNGNPHFLIDIVGYVLIGEEPLSADKNVLGGIDQLINIVKNNIVDEVVFDLPNGNVDDFEDIVFECESMGVTVSLVMYTLNLKISKPDMSLLGKLPVLTFKTTDFSPWQLLAKRIMDILFGAIGLVLTSVVFIFIAPAIKLESEGPILFAQNRMGRNGRVFKFYKFRSMYKDAEERKKALMEQNEVNGHMFKITNDPRITKVGKFLRKTSLDELPQFWNILMGDMSLVGTRPPTLDEVSKYETRHWRRLSIKPGLTGMWQVSGRSDILDFDEVVALDLEYIDNWSIWLDIKLIFKTFLAVFHMKGSK